MKQEVITVDSADRETGRMEKLEAHLTGTLHRAFSVFVFNSRGDLLIHRRAEGKYHSAGLWSNTCCSHPFPGEEVAQAAARRLKEEMGMEAELQKCYAFIYRAEVGGGLIEHEYDHVFFGRSDRDPLPDPEEVQDWKWVAPEVILADMDNHPALYTAWFRIAFPGVLDHVRLKYRSL